MEFKTGRLSSSQTNLPEIVSYLEQIVKRAHSFTEASRHQHLLR